MQYFVIWNDGQKFGPADVATLNEWVAQGRVTPTTELESVVDGTRLQAGSLPGLNFGTAAPVAEVSEPATPTETVAAATSTQYYVIGADGSKYGPADVATLTQWAADNRLTPNSELEDATTGVRTTASFVAGIVFPTASAVSETVISPNQPTNTGYTPAAAQVGQSNYPRANYTDPNAGKTEFIISLVCSAIGLLCCPCLFSIAGIVLGVIAQKKGHPNGQIAMIVGIASLILGFVIGFVVNMNNPALQQLMNPGR